MQVFPAKKHFSLGKGCGRRRRRRRRRKTSKYGVNAVDAVSKKQKKAKRLKPFHKTKTLMTVPELEPTDNSAHSKDNENSFFIDGLKNWTYSTFNKINKRNSNAKNTVDHFPGSSTSSPASLAVKRLHLEKAYHQEKNFKLNQYKTVAKSEHNKIHDWLQKSKLEALTGDESDKERREIVIGLNLLYKQRRMEMESRLSAMLDKFELQDSSKEVQAFAIDELIGAKQKDRAKPMESFMVQIDYIKVTLASLSDSNKKMCRYLEPVKYFSELQAQVETLYGGHSTILSVAGTDDVVGSQFELLRAYRTCKSAELCLDLLIVPPILEKRKFEEIVPPSDETVLSAHTGPWTSTEIELFSKGVKEIGWGRWSDIAELMETRNRGQVYKFSKTVEGARYKPVAIDGLNQVLFDLAAGFKCVAEEVQYRSV